MFTTYYYTHQHPTHHNNTRDCTSSPPSTHETTTTNTKLNKRIPVTTQTLTQQIDECMLRCVGWGNYG
eukprot:m.144724 g.144724  ORF g.144724 m.144724 type:complete len:68 (+) comp30391_c0_seq2:195-398(+)